jgi:dTDP-glucose pyrophosphorylase
MSAWQNVLVGPDASVRETIAKIDADPLHIALVVDGSGRLLGTVTDGDVRRAMLKGHSLDSPVRQIMNPRPTVAGRNEPRDAILSLMRHRQLRQIPLVDERRHVVGVESLDELMRSASKDNVVVVMAGGLGSRLQPLTDSTPKPMLEVGGKPILETVLDGFMAYGLNRFYFAVNYRSEMIKAHFGDGSRWGASIRYLEEDRSLGTAGALSLLPETPSTPLIVMNGDVLTTVNFEHLLDFHAAQGAAATICVRNYEIRIPYGVVNLERQRITRIDEKPAHRFFVNAGIYVLEPRVLKKVPPEARFDMPSLIEALIADGDRPAAFPIREYWIDIGQLEDYQRAHGEYGGVFS